MRTATRSNRSTSANGKATTSAAITSATSAALATSSPDYANMPTDGLLSAFWSYVKPSLADVASAAVNTIGANVGAMVQGELGALASVALGLRKAHGRNISAAAVEKDLGITIPSGYTPTFALYLSAARLRPDDANERKIGSDVKSAIRAKIRATRKG